MSIVTDRGPTENDIVIATNGSKRQTKGTRSYLALVTQNYEEYIQHNKFSKEKKKIVQKILTTSLEKGRFMKEVEGVTGQWFILSEEEAKERVKQRFCDETRARKKKRQEAETKVAKKVTSKINKTKKFRKIVKDAKVSKAAKVATGTKTAPHTCTPKRGVTTSIVRQQNVVTPTNDDVGVLIEHSPNFDAATTIHLPTPVVPEKYLTPNDAFATKSSLTLPEPEAETLGPPMPKEEAPLPLAEEDGGAEGLPNIDDLDLLEFLGNTLDD